MSDRFSHRVDIVTASAGTGKTHRLTTLIEAAIAEGGAPEGILATTFTVKAAEELRERIRSRLLQSGATVAALRLLGARIGTVNGVSGGLIGEEALALGLSPVADVVSEETRAALFCRAADAAIARHADRLDALGRRFGHDEGRLRHDWRDDLIDVVATARANDMESDRFGDFARRSIDGFTRLMRAPLPGETAASLDGATAAAMATLLRRYPTDDGLTAGTAKALATAREIARQKIADVPWSDWARLSKLAGTKADDPHFVPLRDAASAFARHPRLLADVRDFVETLFTCASEASTAWESWKRGRGLVDFVDQERIALTLLRDPDRAAAIAETIEHVFVDEFQDTSPLQLALFSALSQIAQSSTWVGDPKQAIYGFRGTDPDLISVVAPKIRTATGGGSETLAKNWRSRPGLVAFVNDAFSETFRGMGMPAETTRTDACTRVDLDGQASPLEIWHLRGRTIAARTTALATGIKRCLDEPDLRPIADGDRTRSLRPGDVAVLCTSNDRCLALAGELARFGVKVALERGGLFGTPEVRLALAALRWCADRHDTLALAEMAELLHVGDDQPAWFEISLGGEPDALIALVPIAADLAAIPTSGAHATPLEFADAILIAGGIADEVRRWGESAGRLANLEALRTLVATYQDERAQARAPATVTDLCVWLSEQEGRQPASRADNAVTVLTYHRAKGLEWPLVILTDLDREPRRNAFGLHVESDREANAVDWRDPLAGRWLRLWPWPLGAQAKDVVLDGRAAAIPEGREAERREREEWIRVLYVGATRARDHLVLALPPSKTGEWAWLDDLKGRDGGPAITIPSAEATTMTVDGVDHPARVSIVEPEEPMPPEAEPIEYRSPRVLAPDFEPMALRPSDAAGAAAHIVEEIDLGRRLPFAGSPDMTAVGEALHRFLAADHIGTAIETRVALAHRLLTAWNVTGIDPRDVVEMSDRFHDFIATRWPGARVRCEVPVTHRRGDRTLFGRIDALVETDADLVVFDHKSFPGAKAQWHAQAEKYAGQLAVYAEALRAHVDGRKTVRTALHLPISGTVLMIESSCEGP